MGRLSKDKRLALIKRIARGGEKYIAIAVQFGVSREYVRQIAARLGTRSPRSKLSSSEIQIICDAYALVTHAELCGLLGRDIAQTTIHRIRKELGLPARRRLIPVWQSKQRRAHRLLLQTWLNMLARCTKPRHPQFHLYGGRGITVCDRWKISFDDFLADMGLRPPGTSLDRIDNDGPYSPENCRWADRETQCNNRRSNTWIEHEGMRLTLTQWSRRLGIPVPTLGNRLRRGWCVSDVLSNQNSQQKRSA